MRDADAAVYASGFTAGVFDCGDDSVGLGVEGLTPGFGVGGGLVDYDGGEEAETVEVGEGSADALKGGGVYCAYIADLDEADMDVFFGDFGDEEVLVELGEGGVRVVLEEALNVGLVAGFEVFLGEGGLFEVFEDGRRRVGGGGVGCEGGLEALEIGTGFTFGRGGGEDGEVEFLGELDGR